MSIGQSIYMHVGEQIPAGDLSLSLESERLMGHQMVHRFWRHRPQDLASKFARDVKLCHAMPCHAMCMWNDSCRLQTPKKWHMIFLNNGTCRCTLQLAKRAGDPGLLPYIKHAGCYEIKAHQTEAIEEPGPDSIILKRNNLTVLQPG